MALESILRTARIYPLQDDPSKSTALPELPAIVGLDASRLRSRYSPFLRFGIRCHLFRHTSLLVGTPSRRRPRRVSPCSLIFLQPRYRCYSAYFEVVGDSATRLDRSVCYHLEQFLRAARYLARTLVTVLSFRGILSPHLRPSWPWIQATSPCFDRCTHCLGTVELEGWILFIIMI